MTNSESGPRSPEQLKVALARAVVELREIYPGSSDKKIAHGLLNTGLPEGEEIEKGLLERIVNLASRIEKPTFSLLDELRGEEPGVQSYLGVIRPGDQRHFGMDDAPTSDGVSRDKQGASEQHEFPDD